MIAPPSSDGLAASASLGPAGWDAQVVWELVRVEAHGAEQTAATSRHPDVLKLLFDRFGFVSHVAFILVHNTQAPAAVMAEMAERSDGQLACLAALHPNCPEDVASATLAGPAGSWASRFAELSLWRPSASLPRRVLGALAAVGFNASVPGFVETLALCEHADWRPLLPVVSAPAREWLLARDAVAASQLPSDTVVGLTGRTDLADGEWVEMARVLSRSDLVVGLGCRWVRSTPCSAEAALAFVAAAADDRAAGRCGAMAAAMVLELLVAHRGVAGEMVAILGRSGWAREMSWRLVEETPALSVCPGSLGALPGLDPALKLLLAQGSSELPLRAVLVDRVFAPPEIVSLPSRQLRCVAGLAAGWEGTLGELVTVAAGM